MSLKGRTPELIGSLSSLATGTKSTLNIPRSHTYFALGIGITITAVTLTAANIATYIDKIELRVNGEPRFEISGAALPLLWTFRDTLTGNNFIPLLLAQPHMRTAAGEDVSGYGTLDMNSFDIEVTLASGAHVITKLELYAVRGANTPLGPHYRVSSYARNAAGAGDFEVNNITRPHQRIFSILADTADVDKITMRANDQLIHVSRQETREGFLKLSKRTEGGATAIDLCSSNRLEDGFEVGARDVRLTMEMTGAAAFNVVTESIESMPALG